jgi:hypothetical protein
MKKLLFIAAALIGTATYTQAQISAKKRTFFSLDAAASLPLGTFGKTMNPAEYSKQTENLQPTQIVERKRSSDAYGFAGFGANVALDFGYYFNDYLGMGGKLVAQYHPIQMKDSAVLFQRETRPIPDEIELKALNSAIEQRPDGRYEFSDFSVWGSTLFFLNFCANYPVNNWLSVTAELGPGIGAVLYPEIAYKAPRTDTQDPMLRVSNKAMGAMGLGFQSELGFLFHFNEKTGFKLFANYMQMQTSYKAKDYESFDTPRDVTVKRPLSTLNFGGGFNFRF